MAFRPADSPKISGLALERHAQEGVDGLLRDKTSYCKLRDLRDNRYRDDPHPHSNGAPLLGPGNSGQMRMAPLGINQRRQRQA